MRPGDGSGADRQRLGRPLQRDSERGGSDHNSQLHLEQQCRHCGRHHGDLGYTGTLQSATVNTVFATALQATVKDPGNNPVSGVTMTFTPSTGASAALGGSARATAVTNSSGVATAPTLTANGQAGSYTTASVAGVATNANFSLTNSRYKR
jgi:hypothetical protein